MINQIIDKFKRDGLFSVINAIIKYPFNISKRKAYKRMLRLDNMSEKFTEIYKNNFWSSKESSSGKGSEISYTQPLRSWLIKHIPKYKVKKFVDAPCGDFNWMKNVLLKLNINYVGLDIVESIIKRNTLIYGNKNIKFQITNICEDEIPCCDLIMVRDCLFHLSYEDIEKFLKNLERTDYKYLLTTTHLVDKNFRNKNIASGDFRLIDLFQEPFNFNSKLIEDRVLDFPKTWKSTKKEMILLKKKNVPKSILFD